MEAGTVAADIAAITTAELQLRAATTAMTARIAMAEPIASAIDASSL